MTLTEFRATGRDVDLATIPHAVAQDMTGPGRVYAGELLIEGIPGFYTLTIGNSSIAGGLERLEEKLYEFGVAEGYIS